MPDRETPSPSFARRYWSRFSYVGLVVATLFFAASLTPTLLPRHFLTQGLLSGFALAVGYAVGVSLVLLWFYLEIPEPPRRVQRIGKVFATLAVATVAAWFLYRATVWQNSIRQLMQMHPVETAYPWRVALIAGTSAAALIAVARTLRSFWNYLDRKIQRVVPRRISYLLSLLAVAFVVLLLVNDVFARFALRVADAAFLEIDMAVDEGIQQPEEATACGSASSLIDWDTIGRQGKRFVLEGPTRAEIAAVVGREALQPLRVYVGLGSRETMEERAELALQELQRVGGFDRSVLIVATPTGTGWLDPGAVDTVEYLHGGDTAIVTMQYSYLPSWITILVDPHRSSDSASVLFDKIYQHWTALPEDHRPRLYLHGLSLGSLGAEASADLFTIFEDPIQGGVFSGPPFPSVVWSRLVRDRNPDSSMWLPRFRDGSMVRFTGRRNSLPEAGDHWGSMRFVYIQHASDPMTFFSPTLLYRRPDWLVGERGPDVSAYFQWFPIVTFLQTGFDIPMATSVPTGYGHNIAPASYIDAWIAVSDPPEWTDELTRQLKHRFEGH